MLNDVSAVPKTAHLRRALGKNACGFLANKITAVLRSFPLDLSLNFSRALPTVSYFSPEFFRKAFTFWALMSVIFASLQMSVSHLNLSLFFPRISLSSSLALNCRSSSATLIYALPYAKYGISFPLNLTLMHDFLSVLIWLM